jgi:hypothetical protein
MTVTRDQLKALIEQMPEDKLDLVRMNLESILHPLQPNPWIERIMRRSEEFRRELPERLKRVQAGCKPEMIRGFSMGGGFGSMPGGRFDGEHMYSWQEDRTRVTHRMALYNSYEIDIVDRLQLTEDEKMLIYDQEIYVGDRAVKRREEFPLKESEQNK